MFKKASPKTSNATPNIDDVRRQSRHRLIGASLLVLVAVVGFPMVFDTQPRPISVDLPILIPAQPAVSPLTPVAAAPTASNAPPAKATPAPAPAPAVVAPVKPVAQPAEKPAEKAADKPSAKPPAQAAAPVAEAQTPTKPDASGERFVVQVGAYADVASARVVRQKIERAGLKTYTQVAKTPQGNRTRVRLGPFNSRAEAERAAQKIKSLGLTPSILTL
ncbi:MAG: SPOR domain-containing protein [Hydrogenophaga sp.]